jgi:CheY-like chemotaxis protein
MDSTILVVEDDPSTRSLLMRALTNQGYAVTTVSDGEAALAAVSTSRPDLVLADIYLPRLDGLTVMEHIRRADPCLPIIALSAAAGAPEMLSSAAATDRPYLQDIPFLAKPFALTTLYLMVDRMLPILS